ncbi:hypothetical protein F5Y17DRAFT_74876 [Xylariaceae sp. FL0594]|nr:hypothetical protein F5Y17DRAFT_74876 [Xylariaceae sp. FL0594]
MPSCVLLHSAACQGSGAFLLGTDISQTGAIRAPPCVNPFSASPVPQPQLYFQLQGSYHTVLCVYLPSYHLYLTWFLFSFLPFHIRLTVRSSWKPGLEWMSGHIHNKGRSFVGWQFASSSRFTLLLPLISYWPYFPVPLIYLWTPIGTALSDCLHSGLGVPGKRFPSNHPARS